MKKTERRVFLAELDALLDTRLSLYKKYHPDKVVKLLKNGYLRRNVDDFPGLPFREFRKLYEERDKSVLVEAIATPIIEMVREFGLEVAQAGLFGPHDFQPVFMVNIWPYKLSDKECEVIRDMLMAKTRTTIEVEIVNFSYEALDNSQLTNLNVAYFAIYDYVKYLNIHLMSESLKSKPSPSIALVIPRLIFSEPNRQFSYDLDRDFQITEDLINPFIGLNFMPVSDFCIDIPHDLTVKLKED